MPFDDNKYHSRGLNCKSRKIVDCQFFLSHKYSNRTAVSKLCNQYSKQCAHSTIITCAIGVKTVEHRH